MNLIDHYRKLWFFALNRFKGDNYRVMSEYFAQLLMAEIEEFVPLRGKKVLDVGGGRGSFCKVLNEQRGCDTLNLEPKPRKRVWPNTLVGYADSIPFADNEFDLVICRGVLEHVPTEKQQPSMDEMYRVTQKGGICYIVIPPWYNPHAGHALKPFHVLPFKLAKRLRKLIGGYRFRANSLKEARLYPITFRRMLKLISSSNFKVIATRDVHFRLHFLTRIPIIREIMVPAVAFVLTKE